MTRATVRGRAWRTLALFAAILLLGGVTLSAVPAQDAPAQPPKQDPPPRVPSAPRVITLPPGTSSDVVECVELINSKIEKGWQANKLTPARPSTDYEFIRRATLDLIGRIATEKEIAEYARDPKEYRRSKLIDRLLASPEYPRHWANLWANWLLTRTGPFGEGEYHDKLAGWLEDKLANNVPFDKLVTELLTARGANDENPQVNFILAHVGEPVPAADRPKFGQFEMVPATSRITRMFLGIQTQCTQCHDHPFDANLKQSQFWGVNAYLRQVTRQGNPPVTPRQRNQGYPKLTLDIDTNANKDGVVNYEKRNGITLETKAVFMDGTKLPEGTKDRREELAKAIIAHANFGPAYINRTWGVFFGKGFTNPVDDFNEQNPVSNPELLKELGQKFRDHGYDMKKVIRWICNSEAYSLSCIANKTNDKPEHEPYFSRMLLKAMSPEQLLESLMTATGDERNKADRKALRDRWMGRLVANFGDDEGNEVNFNGTIVQALLMMNGEDLNQAIAKSSGTMQKVMKLPSHVQRIEALYLATLNRKPTQKEVATITDRMKMRPQYQDKDPAGPYQDLLWALLNSNEFMLNH